MIKITLKNSYEIFSCPLPTKDLALNTNNRNDAIEADHIHYGHLNLNDEEYWKHLADHWKTDVSVAKKSLCGNCAAFDISPQMKECMPGSVQKDGVLGYCWMHKFKCHSARTCYTWAAGGPIEENDVSTEWAEKNEEQLSEEKDDRCTRIAKSRYEEWPSAYASGAVVRCRDGKIWKDIKEEEIIEMIKEELETFLDEKKKKKQQKGKRRAAKVVRRKKRKKKAGTESGKESSLRDWFGRKGAPGKSGGWVDCNTCRKDKKTGRKKCKPCGRQKGEKRAKYPSCRPTPGACGESGRGKTWGKKSAKGKK